MPSRDDPQSHSILVRRHAAVATVDPGVVLDHFEGEERGFWGRGDRWVAWAGCLREFGLGASAGGGGEGDRFDQVRRGLADIGIREPDGSDAGDPPRIFGGFSFLDAEGSERSWEGFPRARFVLPRFLVRGGPGGCTLTVQALNPAPDDGVGPGSAPSGNVYTLNGRPRSLARELERVPVPPRVLVPRAAETLAAGDERERRVWSRAVEAVLREIREGTVDKAVLARIQDLELDRSPAIGDLVRFLRHENPRAHVFLFEFDPGRTLFGAAPEVLAELRQGRVHATAVAGSIGRGADREGDRRQAEALLASAKDRSEHRMTVDEMRSALDPRVERLEVEDAPRILRLARIQHLETPLDGTVRSGEDVLSLVRALHPTPAVCGRPRDAAMELIRAHEPFERGWYAGPVGWVDSAGDGDFVPALRIGVGTGRRWRLFAGAGLVAASDPELEWDETTLKFEPALRALRAGAASAEEADEDVPIAPGEST